MPNSKQIVYLSQSQYAELIANGTITVDGVTVTYDENDIYVTPQAEPVTDVRVAGTSVAANGVANIPIASQSSLGVVKQAETGYSVSIQNDGTLKIVGADTATIKSGSSNSSRPILPVTTHVATFYGLTRAAGVNMASSANEVGTYTPEAKGAIQQMLGVSDLIATAENSLVASKAYAISDIFTANGKLYKATAAIAANDTIILQNEGETISGANAVEVKLGDYVVHDVQVNGTSIVSNGVANVELPPDMSAHFPGTNFRVDTGNNNFGTAQCATAEGSGTTASGDNAHAEGSWTTASGQNSHAEGIGTTARGEPSHAEGAGTTALGAQSHAEGAGTTARGAQSHAEGASTLAFGKSQHVFGEYNVQDGDTNNEFTRATYVEIVGNGTADNARSNARTLDWSGNEALAGSITLGKGTADEVTLTAANVKALLALLN